MFIYTKEVAFKIYPRIMAIIRNALTAAVYLPEKNEDADLIDYFKYLRERILECITCIIQCLKELNQVDLFAPHVPDIIKFIETVTMPQYEPHNVSKNNKILKY